MRLGNEEYVISLVIVSSLLAIVTVPAWLLLLGPRFDRLEALDPATVAAVLGKSFLLPMLLGIAVRWIMPDASARLSDVLLKFVGIVFSACALLLLATHWQVVGAILGDRSWRSAASRLPRYASGTDGRSGPERSNRARSHLRDTTRRCGHGDRGCHARASHRRADRGLHAGFGAGDHSVHEVARPGNCGRAAAFELMRPKESTIRRNCMHNLRLLLSSIAIGLVGGAPSRATKTGTTEIETGRGRSWARSRRPTRITTRSRWKAGTTISES